MIQLAVLCKVNTVQEKGYHNVLDPLIQDLISLEQNGVYVEKLGASIKGTVLYVAPDNLAANALAGFQEGFTAGKICRFCMANQEEIQTKNVSSGFCTVKTKAAHDRQVREVKQDPAKASHYGFKGRCALSENLKYFHVFNGFPPDILQDFLEGVIPFELSLCI